MRDPEATVLERYRSDRLLARNGLFRRASIGTGRSHEPDKAGQGHDGGSRQNTDTVREEHGPPCAPRPLRNGKGEKAGRTPARLSEKVHAVGVV